MQYRHYDLQPEEDYGNLDQDNQDTNPFTVRFSMLQAVSSTVKSNALCQRQTEASHSCQGQGNAFISTELLPVSWTAKRLEFESRRGKEFSLLQVIQTGSGVHQTSYPMGTGVLSLGRGVKRQGHEAEHSPPTSAEVKKMWIYASIPPYAFMA
jgi:hypothetical protein